MHRVFLIKPASSACNLRCRYCFYNDESENRNTKNYGIMGHETAHMLIDRAFEKERDTASFGFQGGEPTLAGLPFYEDFVSYASRKAGDRRRVDYALQTNGFLIDRQWASFFRENHFLIGLSLDGNKKTHDTNRVDSSGKGSYNRVFNNAKLLQRENVDFNILTTATRQIVQNTDALYDFYKRNGFRYLQFTACIDPIASERGTMDYSLDAESYGRFLIRLFDLYYRDWKRGDYTSIRYFDNLISLMVRGRAEECGMNGVCGKYYVVEADGSVFPCDFYVLDGYCLGNIMTDSFEDLDRKRTELGFVEKSMKKEEECTKCPYFHLCRGGCRRDRENFATGELEKTYLCEAYKTFFSVALPALEEMAQAEARAIREVQQPAQ